MEAARIIAGSKVSPHGLASVPSGRLQEQGAPDERSDFGIVDGRAVRRQYANWNFRAWVKRREHPLARLIFSAAQHLRHFHLPVILPLHRTLFYFFVAIKAAWTALWRIVWFTPMFQASLLQPAKNLYVFGGMPLVMGTLDIEIGENSRISGQTTLSGRTASAERPLLSIGSNVEVGWQTTIAVGSRVEIGNNVLIAGKCFLAGYPGHPLDPALRAAGLPDTEDQVGEIVLEDDVWLATGVTVLAGVRIGKGAIVTAGSVVFRDIPAGFIATGNPAKAVMPIPTSRPIEE